MAKKISKSGGINTNNIENQINNVISYLNQVENKSVKEIEINVKGNAEKELNKTEKALDNVTQNATKNTKIIQNRINELLSSLSKMNEVADVIGDTTNFDKNQVKEYFKIIQEISILKKEIDQTVTLPKGTKEIYKIIQQNKVLLNDADRKSIYKEVQASVDALLHSSTQQIEAEKTLQSEIQKTAKVRKSNQITEVLNKSYDTGNKKMNATAELERAYNEYKPFLESVEDQNSIAGAKAAYAYLKAYENAMEKGVAKSKLDKFSLYKSDLSGTNQLDRSFINDELEFFERYLDAASDIFEKVKEINPEAQLSDISEFDENLGEEIGRKAIKAAQEFEDYQDDIDLFLKRYSEDHKLSSANKFLDNNPVSDIELSFSTEKDNEIHQLKLSLYEDIRNGQISINEAQELYNQKLQETISELEIVESKESEISNESVEVDPKIDKKISSLIKLRGLYDDLEDAEEKANEAEEYSDEEKAAEKKVDRINDNIDKITEKMENVLIKYKDGSSELYDFGSEAYYGSLEDTLDNILEKKTEIAKIDILDSEQYLKQIEPLNQLFDEIPYLSNEENLKEIEDIQKKAEEVRALVDEIKSNGHIEIFDASFEEDGTTAQQVLSNAVEWLEKYDSGLLKINKDIETASELNDAFIENDNDLDINFADDYEGSLNRIIERLKEIYKLRNEQGFEKYIPEATALIDRAKGAGAWSVNGYGDGVDIDKIKSLTRKEESFFLESGMFDISEGVSRAISNIQQQENAVDSINNKLEESKEIIEEINNSQDIDINESSQNNLESATDDVKSLSEVYNELVDNVNEYNKETSKSTDNNINDKISELQSDSAQKTTDAVEKEGNAAEKAEKQIKELNEAKKENKDINKKMASSADNSADSLEKEGESSKKVDDAINNLIKNEKKYQTLANKINSGKYNASDIADFGSLSREREKNQKIIATATTLTDKQKKSLQEYNEVIKESKYYIEDLNDAEKELAVTKENNSKKNILNNTGNIKSDIKKEKTPKISMASDSQLTNNIIKINNLLDNNKRLSDEARTELNLYLEELKNGGVSSDRLKEISNRFKEISYEEKKAGRIGQNLFDIIKKGWTNVARYIGTFGSFYQVINWVKQSVSTVIELDTAITELRKVSNATEEQLINTFEKSTKTAKELGSTINEVINITSDWARLGYDVKDAENLAKVTTLFKTVGDNMSSENASQYLVSTLQGFQIKAQDAESVVDKFNEVANNFAIDTAGIGEALQRSAASFYAANTDLSEAIALVTTANAVAQNPESVGTTFKTLSARIRGAKTELEELGEEEDQFTQTTSTLRDLVKSLTGFDIMSSETEFKSIYEIMIGIGDKWKELTDIERASLGEALAGKRNANVLYAVMQNIDDLKDAYKTAEESAGSAAEEQENYAKSVQYSIDVAKANIQDLISRLLNSQDVKLIIDSFSGSIENLGTVIEMVSAPLSYLIKAISELLKLLSSFDGAFINSILAFMGAKGIKKFLDLTPFISQIKLLITSYTTLSKVESQQAVARAVNSGAISTEMLAEKALNKEKLQEALVTSGISEKEAALVAQRYLGISSVNQYAIAIGALVAIVGASTWAWNHFSTSVAKAEEEIEKISDSIKNLNSEIEELENIGYKNNDQIKRLTNLQEELNIQERLLEIAKEKKAIETAKSDSIADYFDKDNYLTILRNANRKVDSNTNSYEVGRQLIDEIMYGKSNQEYISDINNAKLKYDKSVGSPDREDKLSKYKKSIIDAEEKAIEYKEKLDDLKNNSELYIKTIGENSYKEMVDSFTNIYNELYSEVIKNQKELGIFNFSSITFDPILNEVDGLKDHLVDLAKTGELTSDNLKSFLNQSILDALEAANLETKDLYQYLMNIADPNKSWRESIRLSAYSDFGVTGNESYDKQSQIDKIFADAGIDLNNEEHLQAYLDIKSEFIDDSKSWTTSEWISHIQDKITEKPVTIGIKFAELMDSDKSAAQNTIKEQEQILKDSKKKLKELQDKQKSLDSNMFGNIDTNHRNIIYWNDDNFNKYKKQLTSLGYTFEDLKDTYSTTMFDTKILDDGRAITFTPILPDGSILDKDSIDTYLNDLSGEYDADNILFRDSYSNNIVGDISDIDDKVIDQFKKDFDKGLEGIGNPEQGNDILTNIIVDSYKNSLKNISPEDLNDIYNGIYEVVDEYTAFSKTNGQLSVVGDLKTVLNASDSIVKRVSGHIEQDNIYSEQIKLLEQIEESQELIEKNSKAINSDSTDYTKYRDELIGLAQAGKLDETTLKNYEHLNEILQALGHTTSLTDDEVKELVNTINSLSQLNTVDQLNNYGDNIGVLNDAYKNYKSGKRITAEQLGNIQSKFGDLESYREFEKAVMSGEKNLQKYFDAIVTEAENMGSEYGHVFDGLTRENQQFWVEEMKKKGIKNAMEASEEYLQHEEAVYDEVMQELSTANGVASNGLQIASKDLEKSTLNDVAALTNEANALGYNTEALALYKLQKFAASGATLDENNNIQALKDLATQAQLSANVLDLINQLIATSARLQDAYESKNLRLIEGLQAEANRLNSEIQSALTTEVEKKTYSPNLDYTGAVEDAKSSGKEAADAYVEAFEKELKELDELKDAGVISEREYLERLKALYVRYFANRKEYLKQFKQYEKQYLEGMKALYESAISAAITVLNDQINDLEKAKDKAVKALEAERDSLVKPIEKQINALEDEKEVLEDQRKAIEKQKEAFEEANNERERAINLQKAQYDLERANAQRTKLIYKNGQMQYVNDNNEVRDKKKQLADAQYDIEVAKFDKQISALDKQIESIDGQIDNLNKKIDEINEHYDELIEQTEKFYDEQIEALQDLVDMWEELQHKAEMAEAIEALQALGLTVDDILSGNMEAFNMVSQGYEATLAGLTDNVSSVAEAFEDSDENAQNLLDTLLGYSDVEGLENVANDMQDIADNAGKAAGNISGGTGASDSEGSNSESGSVSAEGSPGSSSNTLVDSIDEVIDKEDELKEFALLFEGSEESISAKAKLASEAIFKEDDETSLSGSLLKLKDVSQEVIPEINGLFLILFATIHSCTTQLTVFADKLKNMASNNYNVNVTTTTTGSGGFSGSAYANGNWSADSKGLNGNALVGELGQELVVHKDGTYETVGDRGAEFTNIKSSDIVFNHKQTEELLKNGKINTRGKAYAEGNNNIFSPLSSSEMSKYNLNLTKDLTEKLDFGNQKLTSIDKAISNVTNTNKTVNNNPVINVNNPTFTCTGITGEEVLREIESSFSGLFVNAYQKSMSR